MKTSTTKTIKTDWLNKINSMTCSEAAAFFASQLPDATIHSSFDIEYEDPGYSDYVTFESWLEVEEVDTPETTKASAIAAAKRGIASHRRAVEDTQRTVTTLAFNIKAHHAAISDLQMKLEELK